MSDFQATYYDGKSAKGYKAEVDFDSFGFRIRLSDGFNRSEVNWELRGIHKTDFTPGAKVVMRYGTHPFEYLETSDMGLRYKLKAAYPSHRFENKDTGFLARVGVIGILSVVLGFFGIVALIYFFFLPFLSEQVAKVVPISTEESIGNGFYDSYIQTADIDTPKTEIINLFFEELNVQTDYQIRITVVDDETVNAFAMPGGRIVVFTGILQTMNSYEELVALLGHEFTHVQKRHSTRSIFRALASGLFLSVVFGDATGIAGVVIDNADAITGMSYSRALEKEADLYGLALMKERQISPEGMISLFESLAEVSGETLEQEAENEEESSNKASEFLSTHPLTKSRIDYVKQEISENPYQHITNLELENLFERLRED